MPAPLRLGGGHIKSNLSKSNFQAGLQHLFCFCLRWDWGLSCISACMQRHRGTAGTFSSSSSLSCEFELPKGLARLHCDFLEIWPFHHPVCMFACLQTFWHFGFKEKFCSFLNSALNSCSFASTYFPTTVRVFLQHA